MWRGEDSREGIGGLRRDERSIEGNGEGSGEGNEKRSGEGMGRRRSRGIEEGMTKSYQLESFFLLTSGWEV